MTEIVFGSHAVYHLLKAGRRTVFKIFVARGSEQVADPRVADPVALIARDKKIPIEFKPQSFFSRFEGASHQGIVAETNGYPYEPIEGLMGGDRVLVCDEIQDPQNLGALCRTSLLFGFAGVVIPDRGGATIGPGVCKAAAGAVEYLKISKTSSIAKAISLFKDNGFWVYGADAEGSKDLYTEKFPNKIVVVLGAEGTGLSRLVRERCDILLKIPMSTQVLGSFNASVAGAIVMNEVFRHDLLKKQISS